MVRIGTCSWKYPSWAGLVYSQPEGIDYLAEYATRFSSVEVDQWFWAMPDPRVAESYAASVPETFRFTVKAPNTLTWANLSARKGQEPGPNPRFLSPDTFVEFLRLLDPLRSRLGMVMLQFEYLNRKKMASLDEFLKRLDAFLASVPAGWPVAVETRNGNYLTDSYFSLLRDRGAAHVFLQGYWMPPVAGVYAKFRDRIAGAAVIRLHGPDREGMEEKSGGAWDRIVEPRDGELKDISDMVREMGSRNLDVYLNINNHFEGSAPLTIDRLRGLGVLDQGMGSSATPRGSPDAP
jgi:uncharacterized protein YecE (DUF72 family)